MSHIEDRNTPIGAMREGDTFYNDRGERLYVGRYAHEIDTSEDKQAELPLGNHDARLEGDEYFCIKCGKRWDKDESEPPCVS